VLSALACGPWGQQIINEYTDTPPTEQPEPFADAGPDPDGGRWWCLGPGEPRTAYDCAGMPADEPD